MELVGVRAAPHETWEALKVALKGVKFDEAVVTLITDWQDHRATARYAVYVREGKHRVLSFDAFGPRFGKAGDDTLRELVNWFLEHGVDVDNFRESVLPPSEYSALFELGEVEANQVLSASANYADPLLYIKRGFASRL
jgi:hypothetical protein